MSDTSGNGSAFSGFPQNGMMEQMWEMMKLNPFAAATGGGAGVPSLGMMSDMLTPLTNVEELDKRITDMRAIEQWLKLNLNMLQSAIQALEVQRATLATLRAFGAYAKDATETQGDQASPFAAFWPAAPAAAKGDDAAPAKASAEAPSMPGDEKTNAADASFDPSGWWNMLQAQFNNLAALAMVQADSARAAEKSAAKGAAKKPAAKRPAATKTAARKNAP